MINSSTRGNRNLKRVRISGEFDADEQGHEMKGQSDDGACADPNAERRGQTSHVKGPIPFIYLAVKTVW